MKKLSQQKNVLSINFIKYFSLILLLFFSIGSSFSVDSKLENINVGVLNHEDPLKHVVLDIEELTGPWFQRIRFLEHVFDFQKWQSTENVITSSLKGQKIFTSNDLGENWKKVWPNDSSPVESLGLSPDQKKHSFIRSFTTSTGRHLLQLIDNGTIYVFNSKWEFVKKVTTGKYHWHGSWSIGENNGTIMYAEYSIDADKLLVWRSQDDGDSWEVVFEQLSNAKNTSLGDIRHFHTCFPWYNSKMGKGVWLVSSGDSIAQCKIWISTDQGNSWKDITDTSYSLSHTQDYTRSIHRYTTLVFSTGDSLLWATDDYSNKDNSAHLVEAFYNNDKLDVKVLFPLSGNSVRAIIDFGEYYLTISEAKKPDVKNAYLHILNKKNPRYIEWAGTIEQNPPKRSGFVYSLGSIMAYKGTAFSFGNGAWSKMLRWKIKKDKNTASINKSILSRSYALWKTFKSKYI